MCQIDERVYVREDGHRSVFHDTRQCDRARRGGRTCSDAKVRRTEYRDPTPSPITNSPLTPSGPRYQARPRRTSVSSRPSTREGPITSLEGGIHIAIGSKKGKDTTVSITTGKVHRSSMGSASNYESPGSDASHTVRTGYADTPAPPLGSAYGGLRPQSGQYRSPSSDESFISPGQVSSPYHPSDDYDTPSLVTTTTAASSGARPIIHNGARPVPSPINTISGHSNSSSSTYRTTEVMPRVIPTATSARTERTRRPTSSHETTAAPEITGRGEDRERRRAEARRQLEAQDRDLAANLMREENSKHVHFNTDDAQRRSEERREGQHRTRLEGHTYQRRKVEQDVQAAKVSAEKEALKRSTSSANGPTPTRRGSVRKTSAQAAEQQRLIAAEQLQMKQERLKADAIDLEEQMLQQTLLERQQPHSLQERQQDLEYYNPRVARAAQPGGQTPIIRRPSQTGQTRPDLSQPRQERRQAPMAYYNNMPRADVPSIRERRPSSSHENRPFLGSVQAPSTADPWDQRTMREALPSARGPQVGLNLPQPQVATRRMQQAFKEDEFMNGPR